MTATQAPLTYRGRRRAKGNPGTENVPVPVSSRAIAHQLGISYNTLRTQLSRLYRKFGVQTHIGVVVAVFTEAMTIVGEKNEIELKRKKS